LVKLMGEVGGRLPGQRRIGGANAFAAVAVAGGAGGQIARRIALVVQRNGMRITRCRLPNGGKGHRGEIGRDGIVLRPGQVGRNRLHLGMLPPSVGIGLQLCRHIAPVEPGQTRCARPVAAPVDPVAGDAGVGRSGIAATQCEDLSAGGEVVGGSACDRVAASKRQSGKERESTQIHCHVEPTGRTNGSGGSRPPGTMFQRGIMPALDALPPVLLPILLLCACKPPPDTTHHMPEASERRGLVAINRVGCGACHVIPGVVWPQGGSGPSLAGFADQGLIAGRLPNRPDLLAAFVRNAPATLPGTTMPAMPLTPAEAHDVAAYLYASGEQ
jgi:mono/diheme cytochrome c family protein